MSCEGEFYPQFAFYRCLLFGGWATAEECPGACPFCGQPVAAEVREEVESRTVRQVMDRYGSDRLDLPPSDSPDGPHRAIQAAEVEAEAAGHDALTSVLSSVGLLYLMGMEEAMEALLDSLVAEVLKRAPEGERPAVLEILGRADAG